MTHYRRGREVAPFGPAARRAGSRGNAPKYRLSPVETTDFLNRAQSAPANCIFNLMGGNRPLRRDGLPIRSMDGREGQLAMAASHASTGGTHYWISTSGHQMGASSQAVRLIGSAPALPTTCRNLPKSCRANDLLRAYNFWLIPCQEPISSLKCSPAIRWARPSVPSSPRRCLPCWPLAAI